MRTFYDSFGNPDKKEKKGKKASRTDTVKQGENSETLYIEKDITLASTLPAQFYQDEALFVQSKERIFAQSWQLVEANGYEQQTGNAFPFVLLPGFLDEPLVLACNETGKLDCFSNVCTHRGNILVHQPGKYKKFICDYHGRKFSTKGHFESMPEFSEAKNFPRICDDLHSVPVKQWNQFPFIALKETFDFDEVATVMDKYVDFMPVSQFRHAPEYSRNYLVNAHWALYCDNYLEGFHIPFVHPELNKMLDFKQYETVQFEHCNLQIGLGNPGVDCFDLPEGHINFGRHISAYYFWVYPNMMFNFYPWGLSLNIVKPLSAKQTKVSFHTYVFDETKFNKGAGLLLDKVEREDEFVVENVQRGISSRFYAAGRFSPTYEKGVHHFHSLISKYLME